MLADSFSLSLLVCTLHYTYAQEKKRGSVATEEADAPIPFEQTVS